jgi:Tol biopolymer transport system component
MEKDPEDRWNAAGDVRRALEWIIEGGSQVGLPVAISARRRLRERSLWAAVVVLGVAAGLLAFREISRHEPVPQVVRFAIPAPGNLAYVTWPRISPDGTTLAFTAQDSSGRNGLWIRPLNSLESHLLVYLEGASGTNPSRPFWSPDSRQLAYFENSQLKKVSVAGGLAQLVCQAENGSDGSWGSSGIIIFDGSTNDSIRQVSAAGGTPAAASRIDRGRHETFNAWPMFLPDGEHYLYLAGIDTLNTSFSLNVGSIRTLEAKPLTLVDGRAEYSASGHLVYLRSNLLVAHPFDADRLEFTGEPVPLANQVSTFGERSQVSVSDQGLMVYQRGLDAGSQRLVWLGRNGDSLATVGNPENIGSIALSPDESRLAYELAEQITVSDIWVRDLKRDVTSRLTFGPGVSAWPQWSPDGSRVFFGSNRVTGRFHVFAHNANGTGADEEIFAADTLDVLVTDVARDGQGAVLFGSKGGAPPDVLRLNLRDKTVLPLVASPFSEQRGALSPDGRFLAYQSDESGQAEIYVRELTATGGKWQISAATGRAPVWRADGRELYYVTAEFDFMAVPISYAQGFEIGTARKLFNRRYFWNFNYTLRSYQVSADGQRFLVVVPAAEAAGSEFIVIQNWPAELAK